MRPDRVIVAVLAVSMAAACSSDTVESPRTAAGGRALASGSAVTGADLQVSGSSNNGSPVVNTTYQYTYQIKNAGPDTAFGVVFVDTLLNGSTVTAAGTTTWSCAISPTATSFRCDIGVLRKGDQVTIMTSVGAFTPGILTNTGIVTSTTPDPQPANDAVTVTVKVQDPAAAKAGPVPTVAFTTLPASPDGGYVFAGGPSGVGFQFTPTVTGPLADLITSTESSGGGRSTFWIYNDDPLNPDHAGTLLFGPMFGTISSTFALDVIAFPKGGPVLTAGQKYWLFGFGATGELSGLWHYSSNVLATMPCAVGPFPGIGGYAAACRQAAFQIVVLH